MREAYEMGHCRGGGRDAQVASCGQMVTRRDARDASGLDLTGRHVGLTQSIAIHLNPLLHLCHKRNRDQMPGL